jgi:dihydrofolate reductase
MQKITESTFASLDGITDDPRAWAMSYFDAQAQQAALEALQASDGMLMGRGTYEYLASMAEQSGPYADAINAIRKYVFSATLQQADWNNSTIIRGDVIAAVNEIKQQEGRGLIIYGHGRLTQTLLEHGLLDEVRFGIHPVLVGRGRDRASNTQPQQLRLLGATPLPSGVVVLTYEAAQVENRAG